MSDILISYLITTHNEGENLQKLFWRVAYESGDHTKEIVVVDDYSTDEKTIEILTRWSNNKSIKLHKHALNDHYGEHKNYGNSLCSGKYIFQIDGDELPNEILLLNLPSIFESNPQIDVFHVPRKNMFIGMTDNDIKKWGWRVNKDGFVNWPDYQSRIYKNEPQIKWERKLHETIVGMDQYAYIPDVYELSLYHEKTIEKQRNDNQRYMSKFSAEDNIRK